MVKEVVTHEEVVALRIVMRKAAVLVQVVGAHLGKIKIALLVPLNQLLVGANRA